MKKRKEWQVILNKLLCLFRFKKDKKKFIFSPVEPRDCAKYFPAGGTKEKR
jgi:hypothetical protein